MGSNMNLRPGKGSHLTITAEVLEFIADATNDVREAYCENGGPELVDAGEAYKVFNLVKSYSAGWEETKDKFGRKLFRSMKWQDGEIRVGIVVNAQGELKLDVRFWYSPDA